VKRAIATALFLATCVTTNAASAKVSLELAGAGELTEASGTLRTRAYPAYELGRSFGLVGRVGLRFGPIFRPWAFSAGLRASIAWADTTGQVGAQSGSASATTWTLGPYGRFYFFGRHVEGWLGAGIRFATTNGDAPFGPDRASAHARVIDLEAGIGWRATRRFTLGFYVAFGAGAPTSLCLGGSCDTPDGSFHTTTFGIEGRFTSNP
jgi:hypothetical protein